MVAVNKGLYEIDQHEDDDGGLVVETTEGHNSEGGPNCSRSNVINYIGKFMISYSRGIVEGVGGREAEIMDVVSSDQLQKFLHQVYTSGNNNEGRELQRP